MPLPSQTELDFEHELPAGRTFFGVRELAGYWRCTAQHVINLIESGEIEVGLDLRGKNSSKTMWRLPRQSVVKFLNARKKV